MGIFRRYPRAKSKELVEWHAVTEVEAIKNLRISYGDNSKKMLDEGVALHTPFAIYRKMQEAPPLLEEVGK